MTPHDAHKLISQGKAILIDCREEQELKAEGTAEGATWMPLSALVDDTDEWRRFKGSLSKDKKIFLFCKMGGRSGRMAEFLACEGFETINLGGFSDWKNAGLPVKAFGNS